jgi:hypothetical protein
MGGSREFILRGLYRWLYIESERVGIQLDPTEWRLYGTRRSTSRQHNGFDCGVYSLGFCSAFRLNLTQLVPDQISRARCQMLLHLLEQAPEDEAPEDDVIAVNDVIVVPPAVPPDAPDNAVNGVVALDGIVPDEVFVQPLVIPPDAPDHADHRGVIDQDAEDEEASAHIEGRSDDDDDEASAQLDGLGDTGDNDEGDAEPAEEVDAGNEGDLAGNQDAAADNEDVGDNEDDENHPVNEGEDANDKVAGEEEEGEEPREEDVDDREESEDGNDDGDEEDEAADGQEEEEEPEDKEEETKDEDDDTQRVAGLLAKSQYESSSQPNCN